MNNPDPADLGTQPARRNVKPRPEFWVSNGTWIWYPECQKLVAKHLNKKPLEWIAAEVLRTARAINLERGRAHLGPHSVGPGGVLFCANKLGLISDEDYK